MNVGILLTIFNKCLNKGYYPDAMKIARVVPIHKGGDTNDVNNYRPISLLSIFDKMIEKIMHKRLSEFLDKYDILFINQFGFRKNSSTIQTKK